MNKPTRAWLAFFGIWFLLLTGLFDFWFESPGLKQWYKVNAALQAKRQEVVIIENRSNFLQKLIKQLETNSVAQEREIRRVLGYLGQQEIVFEFTQ